MGGKPLFFIKLAPFNDCIAEYQLLDMRYVGSKWSWHKGSVGPGRILGRLDKVLCNHLWIDLMEEFFYEYHSSATSDHAPMVLHLVVKDNSGSKPFRNFNFWTECEGYKEKIMKAWATHISGYPQYHMVQKLTGLKKALKEWRNSEAISTKSKILFYQAEFKGIQHSLETGTNNIQLQEQEKELKFNLNLGWNMRKTKPDTKAGRIWVTKTQAFSIQPLK